MERKRKKKEKTKDTKINQKKIRSERQISEQWKNHKGKDTWVIYAANLMPPK